jgi:hypothetical protein
LLSLLASTSILSLSLSSLGSGRVGALRDGRDKPTGIGHVRGREHRRLVAAADELGITQAQLNDLVNAHPGQLRVEGPLRNQSHIDGLPGTDDIEDIVRDMAAQFDLPLPRGS